MPSSGSGTGTPISGSIATTDPTVTVYSAVPLARYAEIINYSQDAFFGVANAIDNRYACRDIWTLQERQDAAFYLREAQDDIENVIGYPLVPKWVTEKLPFRRPVVVSDKHVVEPGVLTEEILAEAASVSHATDPATVSIPTTLTSTDGIKIFFVDDVDEEIIPSSIEVSGGFLNIEIPRARLVKYSEQNNPTSGLLYDTLANFESTVVIKRLYTDSTTQATMVWAHGCTELCSSEGCTGYSATACEVIEDHKIGRVDLVPATYSGGAWTRTTRLCCGGNPEYVTLNYKAGLTKVSRSMELAIVRLAHSKMPEAPCGCDIIHGMWRRDTTVPELLTRERLNCPFGLSNGAWVAWQAASSAAMLEAGSVF